MTSLSKKLLFIVVPALLVIIGLLCALVLLPDSGKVYVKQISQARKLAETGDLQKAIVFYQQAIDSDETKEESYIELAKIYFALNDIPNAINVLRKGFQTTNSAQIKSELERYEQMEENSVPDNAKPLNETGKAEINDAVAGAFSSYDFERYTKDCTVKNETVTADRYSVEYQQYDAVFEYVNSADTPVLDPATGRPYPYARPTSIKLSKISDLIRGVDAGITADQLREMGAKNIEIEDNVKTLGTYVISFEYNDMRISLGCDENGMIQGDGVYNVMVPKAAQGVAGEKAQITVKIIDATTGKNVSGVTLKIRSGKDNRDGEVTETETMRDGVYTVELEPGEYTVEVIADGYNREYVNVQASENNNGNEQTISISPALASNEIRFVLEWGSDPRDLDSHLDGVCHTDGNHTVSVNWTHRKAYSGNKMYAELDLDDTDGFGPETTTLYDTNGTFTFKVHRYSSVGELSQSGATVKIYTSGSSPIVMRVPSDAGEWWTVCTVENGQVKNMNGIRD